MLQMPSAVPVTYQEVTTKQENISTVDIGTIVIDPTNDMISCQIWFRDPETKSVLKTENLVIQGQSSVANTSKFNELMGMNPNLAATLRLFAGKLAQGFGLLPAGELQDLRFPGENPVINIPADFFPEPPASN